MKRKLFTVSLVLLAMFSASLVAQAAEVQKVVVVASGKAKPLPEDVGVLAKSIGDFKFAHKEGVLTVITAKLVAGKIDVNSDCPNNTTFNVTPVLADHKKIKHILEQITRFRHPQIPAKTKLRRINVTDQGTHTHFDVQLDHDTVSLK